MLPPVITAILRYAFIFVTPHKLDIASEIEIVKGKVNTFQVPGV